MTASLKPMLLAAGCAASFALFAAARVPATADAPQPIIWCASDLVSDAQSTSDRYVLSYQAARRALCDGDAAATVRALGAILPDMRSRYKTDGTHWIDYGRTYFYALLATHDDAGARRFLDQFENDWKLAPEERAFWGGDFAHSFAAYVADDAAVPRTPDQAAQHKLDPHLTYALADLGAKDPADATAEVQAVADTGSLYALMLGNLYAQQHDWPHAFAAWIAAAAAGPGSPQMEFYALDRWNVSALEMIYYYRAHAPAQVPAASVFCGSPHDLAVVEQLALGLPQSTGLDATHIVDASIAGGVHARVDVESKGEVALYFDLLGGQWQPVARPAATVAFPNGCPNPRFINRPSGS
jgi:hypothetical protein